MLEYLLQPFQYNYMVKAIGITTVIGIICGFLSSYLMLKGWSLMGDALSHSVVPGVAGAYALSIPYSVGAFFSGLLAALAMVLMKQWTKLREDAIIGFIYVFFFAVGLLFISINPTSVDVQSIIFGNVLAIADSDAWQVCIIGIVTLIIMLCCWKSLLLIFFDEKHAASIGLNVMGYKVLFFALLSACTVAALQTVGAILVIAMVVTPGATAYLLTDRFNKLLMIASLIGALTSLVGAYLSFFLEGATGGIIVCLQTLLFLLAFLFAPKHGFLAQRSRLKKNLSTY